MANLSDVEKLLPTLSPGEKAQILKWVVQELGEAFPGIDTRPDVCGGEACIVRTRIPVWLLEQARRMGASEQALLAAYPSLRAEDLVNAWAYARAHSADIDEQIRENESAWFLVPVAASIPTKTLLCRSWRNSVAWGMMC